MPKRIVESTPRAIAGGRHLSIDTPEVSLANGDLWVKLSGTGELREIYSAGAGRSPSVEPRPAVVSGRLIQPVANARGRWLDRANVFEMTADGARLTALVTPGDPMLVLNFETARRPWRWRFHLPQATRRYRAAWGAQLESVHLHRILLSGVGIACPEADSVEPNGEGVDVRGTKGRFTVLVAAGTPDETAAAVLGFRGFEAALRSALAQGRSWLHPAKRLKLEDPRLAKMYERSLLSIRTHTFDSGAMLAGADGWYKNMWVRDTTYTMAGLDLAGIHAEPRRSYLFWASGQRAPWGAGSAEWQEGAILLMGAWLHFTLTRDAGFLRDMWPYVERWSRFYIRQVGRYRGMIPLVEEWICQVTSKVTWPNAEVHGGLVAASKMARVLGRAGHARECLRAAEALRESIVRDAYDAKRGRFLPFPDVPRDERVDSGMLKVSQLAIFDRDFAPVPPGHPTVESTVGWIKRVLEHRDGLISRFEGSRSGLGYPQGEWGVWPVTTAWMSEYHTLKGEREEARRYLRAIVTKSGFDYDREFWRLPEQWFAGGRVIRTTHDMSWSYGEFLTALVRHVESAPT